MNLFSLDYVDVRDYGDVEYETNSRENHVIGTENMLHLQEVSNCNFELSKKVKRILSDGRMAITLGGDHAIGIGSVDGHFQHNNNVAVIWVDAHADLNTNATSQSGNIHGMPVALLAKELEDYWSFLPGMDWQKPQIPINNFGYIGLRSVDDFERAIIEKYEIAAYGMREIDRLGIVKVVQNVLQRIDPENNKSIHLSFDIDALDSLECPSTGTSVRGGMSLREGILLVEEVFLTGRLNAMDLVEVNPKIGDALDVAKTVNAAIQIIKSACGFDRRGKMPSIKLR